MTTKKNRGFVEKVRRESEIESSERVLMCVAYILLKKKSWILRAGVDKKSRGNELNRYRKRAERASSRTMFER